MPSNTLGNTQVPCRALPEAFMLQPEGASNLMHLSTLRCRERGAQIQHLCRVAGV